MIFNKQLTENITLLYGELNNWKYDENDVQYPIMYYLVFKFYNIVRENLSTCYNDDFCDEMEELSEVAWMDFGDELEAKINS